MKNNFTFIKEVGLLNNDLAEKHLIKFDKIYQEKIYRNIDTNFCELKKSDILKYPLYLSLLDIIQKKFELITGFNDLSFEKLWLVNSLPNDSSKVNLPYVPHIDKRRYLKALIYLHDVSLKHGPIHLGKVKSTIDIEQKRKKLPKDYKEKKLNTIDVEHLEKNLTPILGNAMDVVFFDTNVPHKAGIIEDGYCRKVLRFDFERPFFNPKPTIFDHFINKLK